MCGRASFIAKQVSEGLRFHLLPPVLPNLVIFYIKLKVPDTEKERGVRYFLKEQLSAGYMEKYFIDSSCNKHKYIFLKLKVQKEYFNFLFLKHL